MNHPFDILYRDLLITIFEKLNFQSQTNLCTTHPERKQSCHNYYKDL